MKPGSKLKSQVCDVEIMIIRAGSGQIECGGVAMAEDKPDTLAAIDAQHSGSTLMGKRYVDGAGTMELLCVKGGAGSLSVDGIPLVMKDAKPLPASD